MARNARSVALAARVVFSRRANIALAAGVFAAMMLILLATSDYLYFEPYLIAHIPDGGAPELALIVAMAALAAVALPMGIGSASAARAARRGVAGSMAGATVGVVAGACSCGPITLALVTSLGAAGSATASFLSVYDVPLRLVAMGAMAASIYAASVTIAGSCRAR